MEHKKKYFEEKIYPEYEFLLKTGNRLFPNVASDEIENFARDTLLKAYESLDRFDGKNVRGWLTVILKNTIKNSFRKYRPPTVTIENDTDVKDEDADSLEDTVIENESKVKIDSAISELKPKLKEVYKLYNDGYKYKEIAAKLGIRIGTVMSRINRAKDALTAKIK